MEVNCNMEEPSVLDLLKEKLNPRNWSKKASSAEEQEPSPQKDKKDDLPARKPLAFPWRLLLSFFFALIAQRML